MRGEHESHILPDEQPPRKRKRWGWHSLWMTLLLIVGVVFAASNTPFGRDQVRKTVEQQVGATLQGATLQINRLDGNLLRSPELEGVLLRGASGDTLLYVERARVRYRLRPLLSSKVWLDDVHLTGTRARASQDTSGVWDWTRLAAPSEDEPGSWSIRIDSATVTDTRLRASFAPAPADSVLEVRALDMRLARLEIPADGDILLRRIDVTSRFLPPGQMDQADLVLGLGLEKNRVLLDTLSLQSARSHLTGSGQVDLTALPSLTFDSPDSVRTRPPGSGALTLSMQPFTLADVAAFVPILQPDSRLTGELRLEQNDTGSTLFADVDAAHGGQFLASARWVDAPDGALLSLEMDAQRVDIDRILRAGISTTPLSGRATASLEGPRPDSLSGRVSLQLDPFSVDGMAVGGTQMDATWTDGNATGDLKTRLRGTAVTATASGRWFDPVPATTMNATIEGLDTAVWLDNPTLSGRISARLAGRTVGIDPATMVAEATLTLLPSTFAQVDNLSGRVRATMRDGLMQWNMDTALDAGQVSARGRLAVSEQSMDSLYVQTRGLDVAALLAVDSTRATTSSVSAIVRGNGQLKPWTEGRGAVTIQMDSTRWNAFYLADFSAEAAWTPGRATLKASARPADSSRVDADLLVRADGRRTRIESRQLSWSHIDLTDLSMEDILVADLNGTGSLQAVMGGGDVAELDAVLDVTPSRWGDQRIESLRATVRAGTRRLTATASGQFRHRPTEMWTGSLDSGRFSLDLQADDWQTQDLRAEVSVQMNDLDPLALVGSGDAGTTLSGQLSSTVILSAGVPDSGSLRLDLESSSLRSEPVTSGIMEGALADSLITLDAALSIAEGRMEAHIEAWPFKTTPTFSAKGSAENVALLPLFGRPDLSSDVNLTWTIEGSSFDPANADWRIAIEGRESHLDALQIESLSTRLVWDGMVLDIGDLTAQFNQGNVQVHGPVNLDPARSDTYSDLRATWYIGDLSAIQGLLRLDRLASGEGTVDLQILGSPGALEAEFLVSLAELQINEQRLSSIEASGWTLLDADFLPVEATARVDLGYVALPTLGIRTSSLQIDQRADVFEFSGSMVVDTGNRVGIAGLLNPFADRPWGSVRQLNVVLGGAGFALERPASVVFERGWRVDRLNLRSGDQMVGLTGGYSDSTGFSLRLQSDQFVLDPLGDLAGFPDLQGRLSGSMSLSGNMEYPLIDSDWDILLTEAAMERARITADLQSTPDGLRIDSVVEVPGSEQIVVAGFLPVFPSLSEKLEERANRSADLNLDISTRGGSISWVESFLDPTVVSNLEGRATADIQVSGTINDPYLSGYLDVDDAQFRLPEFGVTYRMNRFRSTLDGVTISVDEARIRSGDGNMDVTGTIDFASLTNSSFDLQAQLKQFRAVRNEELHANVSGDLHLAGRTTRPELSGHLTTFNTSFWLTDTAGGDLDQVELTFDDEVMLAENFGYRAVAADTLADAMWKGLSMDLALVMDRDTWIRQRVNPEMAIELTGRMDVQKDRGSEDVNLFRSIEVNPDRSYIKQFGRDFRIKEGMASFNGPVEEMVLQVTAEYEVPSRLNPGQPEVVITLTLGGRLDDLEFNLTSDPAMENTDIVSYIATGRPASESLQFNDSNLNNQVIVGVAAAQLAGLVEGVASQSLGLDVVDIQQDGLRGTRLTAGKYITPRLFIGVTQPFTFGSGAASDAVLDQERELTIEYKIFEYLLLQLLADASDSPVRVNLAGRYSY